jgi:hypothetical protein
MSENSSIMIETQNEPVTDANDMERDVYIPVPENDIQSEDELIGYVLKLVTSCDDSPTYEDAMHSLEAKQYTEAMLKEYISLSKNQVVFYALE